VGVLQVRTLRGHTRGVTRVEFSGDGAQVVSGGGDIGSVCDTVRVWDVASCTTQVRELAGNQFSLVEGASEEHKKDRYVLTADGNMLRIYKVAKGQQHVEDGATTAPVAWFKAPQSINAVRCHGAAICVGCDGGAVCVLSAPFFIA
jgi:WD40 repeat protein